MAEQVLCEQHISYSLYQIKKTGTLYDELKEEARQEARNNCASPSKVY